MADVKITEYDALAAVAGGDLLEIVDDPSGTPVSKKVTALILVSDLLAPAMQGLSELTSIADSDQIFVLDDPGGTPVIKKITRANFLSGLLSSTYTHVRAKRDSAQNIPHNVVTIISFPTEQYDTLTEFSASNGRFTATHAGYYHINGGCESEEVSWAVGTYWSAGIIKNGSSYATGNLDRCEANVTAYRSSYVSSTVYLNVGEYAEIAIWHNQGGNVNVRGTSPEVGFNYINIDRML